LPKKRDAHRSGIENRNLVLQSNGGDVQKDSQVKRGRRPQPKKNTPITAFGQTKIAFTAVRRKSGKSPTSKRTLP